MTVTFDGIRLGPAQLAILYDLYRKGAGTLRKERRKTRDSLLANRTVELFTPEPKTPAQKARGRVRYYRLTRRGRTIVKGLIKSKESQQTC